MVKENLHQQTCCHMLCIYLGDIEVQTKSFGVDQCCKAQSGPCYFCLNARAWKSQIQISTAAMQLGTKCAQL
ncbi:hypothetical protein HAX54_012246 [Datura stramonium]|uniref:Uncharacterized protein n=1 Tax=Datura stramonium TaxID=4076 RepID=A0ABS8Y5C0_DATST|nr:hypothetical protein [Datura stramonium]